MIVQELCNGDGFVAHDGHYNAKAVPLHKKKSAQHQDDIGCSIKNITDCYYKEDGVLRREFF